MPPEDPRSLADGVVAGDKRAVARALNLVESRRLADRPAIVDLLRALDGRGKSESGHRVGLTGPPGVGKSTLCAALARVYRSRGRTVAIVAVDPTSVRSGGSLLGDRARMGASGEDAGLFFRSYATGGEAGGLTFAAHAAITVLSAAYDVVLIETTGVGQTETDVTLVADTVTLVLQPGSGDTLQFLKAGVMEIPDVLVVQKADHDDLARRALADLGAAIHTAESVGLERGDVDWRPPALATSARTGLGVQDLVDTFDHHRSVLAPTLAEKRRRGAVGWAVRDLERLHGSYGILVLGGRDALVSALRTAHDRGAPAAELRELASERYLKTVRERADAS
ncbi:MAG: methylmalonyl Co-A mutase-associated GTPase MeaB [Polyangiales bacterium]